MKRVTDKQIALFCGFLSLILITIIFFLVFTKTDYNCKDFKSQADAQKIFDITQNDKYNLDGNKNGKACDVYFNALTPSPTKAPSINKQPTPTSLPISEQAASAGQSAQIKPTAVQNTPTPTSQPSKDLHINLPLPTIKLPSLINQVF